MRYSQIQQPDTRCTSLLSRQYLGNVWLSNKPWCIQDKTKGRDINDAGQSLGMPALHAFIDSN